MRAIAMEGRANTLNQENSKSTMTASEINLTLNEVLSRVRPGLQKKILYSIDLIRNAEKMALRLDPVDGFYNTFSGGKDSQCLYHLVKLSGVKAKTHMNLTSVDPPEVIRFVKTQYPDVEIIKPKMSIYEMAKKKKMLPTRSFRWCCTIRRGKGDAHRHTKGRKRTPSQASGNIHQHQGQAQ